MPLPEFSVSLLESQFLTTEHPGPLPEHLVSSLQHPAPLLNFRFHRRPSHPCTRVSITSARVSGCPSKIPVALSGPWCHHPRPLFDLQSLQFPSSNSRLHHLRPCFLHPYAQFYRRSLYSFIRVRVPLPEPTVPPPSHCASATGRFPVSVAEESLRFCPGQISRLCRRGGRAFLIQSQKRI